MTSKQMPRDPIEWIVADGLNAAGISWVDERDPRSQGLDFYLPDEDVFIEVKAMHSDRIAGQMSRAENVIAIQGRGAALLFARWLMRR